MRLVFCFLLSALLVASIQGQPAAAEAVAAAVWTNGPSTAPDFFPIAVWLQDPTNAARYKAAGINLYLGLRHGPTTAQLAALDKTGMRVICTQNAVGLENKSNPIIAGWLHHDEPDNAHHKGPGPLISPEEIQHAYQAMRTADPSRPVLLNLGEGVAWDDYPGRGVRRHHPEDYPEYIKGCDIASFDIYPVVHASRAVAGHLEFVAQGVQRLAEWTHGEKAVWSCIECTHISNPRAKATPRQVRSEVWMALIHGASGLVYFVHEFKPESKEAALLDDPEMLHAVTAINRQIRELAPVLNSPSIAGATTVRSSKPDAPIAVMFKRDAHAAYLLTVAMRNQAVHGTFRLQEVPTGAEVVEVLGESRRIALRNSEFSDSFEPYEAHLYRIATK